MAFFTTILGILVLLSGFMNIHINPLNRYKMHHFEGQHLQLWATRLGLLSLAESIGILLLLPSDFLYIIVDELFKILNFPNSLFLESNYIYYRYLVILSFLLIFICPYINSIFSRIGVSKNNSFTFCDFFKNLFAPKAKMSMLIKKEVLKHDPMENFLYTMTITKERPLVIVTLKNNKVYIGSIKNITEKSENLKSESSINMRLSASGYRNKDNFKLEINYSYYDKSLDKMKDVELFLKLSDVLTVSNFDNRIYQEFSRKKTLLEKIIKKFKGN